jgi:hypothetical protein
MGTSDISAMGGNAFAIIWCRSSEDDLVRGGLYCALRVRSAGGQRWIVRRGGYRVVAGCPGSREGEGGQT